MIITTRAAKKNHADLITTSENGRKKSEINFYVKFLNHNSASKYIDTKTVAAREELMDLNLSAFRKKESRLIALRTESDRGTLSMEKEP